MPPYLHKAGQYIYQVANVDLADRRAFFLIITNAVSYDQDLVAWMILNSMGEIVEKEITDTQNQIDFSAEEIANIKRPRIRFRTNGHISEIEYKLLFKLT